MSFIETIEIKNFKSIRHQRIEGCRRINVFIGYPNTGKSNILEALSVFSIDNDNLSFQSNIRNLFKEIMKTENKTVRQLKNWLLYLKEKNYKADINELKNV
jgi:hypothetical protein